MFRKYKSVHVSEFESFKNENIIDVREVSEYGNGRVPGAKNIPLQAITSVPEKYLDKNKTYYIICQGGVRSERVCNILAKMGYSVVNVDGGTAGYRGILNR